METTLLKLIDYLNQRYELPADLFSESVAVKTADNQYLSGTDNVSSWLYHVRSSVLNNVTNIALVNHIQTSNPSLSAFELSCCLTNTHSSMLPIAGTVEWHGERIKSLHLYYSHWPLYGEQRIRNPVYAKDDTAELPGIIKSYHQALFSGHVEAALACFVKTGQVREPSGSTSGYGLKTTLEDFFSSAFKDGGIRLIYHTLLKQNNQIAAEYTCTHWGQCELTPQAGMEFWDIDAESGLIKSVRIYDEVTQPNR